MTLNSWLEERLWAYAYTKMLVLLVSELEFGVKLAIIPFGNKDAIFSFYPKDKRSLDTSL